MWRSAAPQAIEPHMAEHMCGILTSLRRLLQRRVRQRSVMMPKYSTTYFAGAGVEGAVGAASLCQIVCV